MARQNPGGGIAVFEHETRRLHFAGVTASPTGSGVAQQARNLAMDLGGLINEYEAA